MNITVIKDTNLSNYDDERYVIINADTGEVVDDAQGYGYKSVRNAYRSWAYKTRDTSKDEEIQDKVKEIKQWMDEHKDFIRQIDDLAWYGIKDGENYITPKEIAKMFVEQNLVIDFTPKELLKVYQKGKL